MEHTVKKKKINRISIRITAGIFILIAVARVLFLFLGEGKKSMLLTFCCFGCLWYGVNLFKQTLKPQAYDITYVFLDKKMILKMHKNEKEVLYTDITDLGYVIPNENMNYSLIQIYIGKEQFVIPFTDNTNVAEALYGMLKMKKENAEYEGRN